MPHTHSFIRHDCYGLTGSNEQGFMLLLAETVATEFNRFTGEALVAGKTSLAYPPILAETIPVDLGISVSFWWNEARAPHLDSIFRGIARRLWKFYAGRYSMQIHLLPFGLPGMYIPEASCLESVGAVLEDQGPGIRQVFGLGPPEAPGRYNWLLQE